MKPLALLLLSVMLTFFAAYAQQPPAQETVSTHPADPGKSAEGGNARTANNQLPLFDIAMGLYRKGDAAGAATAFQTLVTQGGEGVAKGYAWLARSDLRLHKVADAETAARKSVELEPNLPTGHSALGEVYFRQGKFPDAEREFLVPLKAGITDPRAYLGEARLSWASSYYKHAKHLIDKAHALDPRDPDIAEYWMDTLSRAERIKFLQEWLASDQKKDESERLGMQAYLSVLLDREARPAAACRLATKVTATELPLESLMIDAQKFRGFGLKVNVNGNPSRLLLDTGASGILLNSAVAERIGLRKIVDRKIGGIGSQGAASGYVAYADSIQIGELQFEGCYIEVVDRKRSMNEDGYIGTDVFENYLVDINFPDRKFKLTELPKPPETGESPAGLTLDSDAPKGLHDRYIAPEMQSYEKFYRFGHDILLPTMVNTTANSRLFLVDTGGYDVQLASDFARQVTKVHSDEFTTLKGISGTVSYVYRADTVKLAFGRFMLKADDVVAFDLSSISNNTGTEVSGILGFSLLYQLDMKIDYRDGLIGFQYDPNRFH
jgi:tetratricopeptide (TPR) repeat protein